MKPITRLPVMIVVCALSLSAAAFGSPTATVSDGARVTFEYTLSVPEKHVTSDQNVLSYVHGKQEVLGGLQDALAGMKEGERKRVELTPEQAYGPYDPKKRKSVSRQQLPAGIQPGAMLKSRESNDFATVLEMDDSSALLDLNHPLAGQNIVYDVHILTIEPAAEGGRKE